MNQQISLPRFFQGDWNIFHVPDIPLLCKSLTPPLIRCCFSNGIMTIYNYFSVSLLEYYGSPELHVGKKTKKTYGGEEKKKKKTYLVIS